MSGADVHDLAAELGLDHASMASLLGVDARTMRRWGVGANQPTGGTLVLLHALRAALSDAGERREAVRAFIVGAAHVGGLGALVYRGIQHATKGAG